MTTETALWESAGRLLAELMPIAIVVAGRGAAPFAHALAEQGAAVELYAADTQPGCDLAVLLAEGDEPGPTMAALIAGLANVSGRLLFVPSPGVAPKTEAWFELFAEHGYQPVVDFDAGFLGQGAFLVDREATAAEGELAEFAERLSGVPAPRAAEPATAQDQARAAIDAALVAKDAELAALQASAEAARQTAEAAQAATAQARAEIAALTEHLRAAQAALADQQRQAAGWDGLRDWVAAVTRRPSHNTLAALRTATGSPRRGLLRRLLGLADKPSAEEAAILADLALLRACPLFDAAWYVACNPTVAQSGIDPVLHYRLTGAAAGMDPGPWFDTALYRTEHPDAGANPLLHAIRGGAVTSLLSRATHTP